MTSRVIDLSGAVQKFELDDRGLSYGDGVFETLLVHDCEPIWWHEHWQRLRRGANVLKITTPDQAIVRSACDAMLEDVGNCVLKIILTRGSGGRGYVVPSQASPRIIISLHPAPNIIEGGISMRWCETVMGSQPQLAGIKHLNRLEQVLARNEWQDEAIFDGLMCDAIGNVVCATSANVFAKIDGHWRTPKIDQAGIAGIARAWVMGQWPHVQEADLSRADVERAEAVFICNAVRGILPVARLGQQTFAEHRDILELKSRLAVAQPAFASGGRRGV